MSAQTVKADRLTRFMLVPPVAFLTGFCLLCILTNPLCSAMLFPSALVFLSSYGIFLIAARKRISRFVRMYVTNIFYLNADSSSAKAMRQSLLLGLCASLVLFAVSGPFSRLVSGSLKAASAFRISLLFYVLHAVEGALYGFTEGAGKRLFVLFLDAVRSVFLVAVSAAAGYTGFVHGKRVDALLETTDACAAYAALFAYAALLVLDMLFLLLLLVVRARELGRMRKSRKSKPRYLGDEPAFFKACGQLMASAALPCALLAVTSLFSGDGVSGVSAFALRFFVIPSICALLVSMRFAGACYRLPGLSDEIETGGMSLRFRRLSHRLSIVLPVLTALLCVLAFPLHTLLTPVPDRDGISMLIAGAFYSALLCAFVVCCLLLSLSLLF